MKRLLVALLLLLSPAARAAVAFDAVLTSGNQPASLAGAPVAVADFVSSVFNVSASRIVVVGVLYEYFTTPPLNSPTTVTWTGGTPACATAFTRQVANAYDDGVGDTQAAEIWTAWTTSACTGVGVTHHNAQSTGSIGFALGAVSLSGGQQAVPVGATGAGPTTSVSGVTNASITALHTGSMIVGVFGTADNAGGLTANAATTIDVTKVFTTNVSSYGMGHSTALTSGPGAVTIGATNTYDFRAAASVEINDATFSGPIPDIAACTTGLFPSCPQSNGTTATSLATASFSTTNAIELICTVSAQQGVGNSATAITDSGITKSTGWTKIGGCSNTATNDSEIWCAVTSAAVVAKTVTATFTATSVASSTLVVVPFSASETILPTNYVCATGTSGAASVSITLASATSSVLESGADTASTTARTATANATILNPKAGLTGFVWDEFSTPGVTGSTAIGTTAPTSTLWGLGAMEVLLSNPSSNTCVPSGPLLGVTAC